MMTTNTLGTLIIYFISAILLPHLLSPVHTTGIHSPCYGWRFWHPWIRAPVHTTCVHGLCSRVECTGL